MQKQTTKRQAHPHYDDAFKQGAIHMITDEKRPLKQVASDLGICVETLRSWLKKSGINHSQTNHDNNLNKKIREFEAQVRSLNKTIDHKDEVIFTLKKSIGILSNP